MENTHSENFRGNMKRDVDRRKKNRATKIARIRMKSGWNCKLNVARAENCSC